MGDPAAGELLSLAEIQGIVHPGSPVGTFLPLILLALFVAPIVWALRRFRASAETAARSGGRAPGGR